MPYRILPACLALTLAPVLQAATISFTTPESGVEQVSLGTGGVSAPQTIGTYDYIGQDYTSFTMPLTMTMFDGDTGVGAFDENNLFLYLDGINTGLQLNGFSGDQSVTQTFVFTPLNQSSLLSALSDGQLIGTVVDTTIPASASNIGNRISLPIPSNTTLAITPSVPEPASVVGLVGLTALGGLSLNYRRKSQNAPKV